MVLIEYVPHGDLLGYLRKSSGLNDNYFKDPETNLTSEQLMRFAWQVADGITIFSWRIFTFVHVSEMGHEFSHLVSFS